MYPRSELALRDGAVPRHSDDGEGPAILIMPGLSSPVAKFEKDAEDPGKYHRVGADFLGSV